MHVSLRNSQLKILPVDVVVRCNKDCREGGVGGALSLLCCIFFIFQVLFTLSIILC